MHRCTVAVASHKNPVRLLAFGGSGKEIRSLIMLSQYRADFLIAIAPEDREKKLVEGFSWRIAEILIEKFSAFEKQRCRVDLAPSITSQPTEDPRSSVSRSSRRYLRRKYEFFFHKLVSKQRASPACACNGVCIRGDIGSRKNAPYARSRARLSFLLRLP